MAPWWIVVAVGVQGWRVDGTGHVDAPAPTGAPTWSVELPGPSNASPVRFGALLCLSVEPTTTWCGDAATGAVAWTATSDVADTLDAARAAEVRALVAAADAAAADLAALQAEEGQLRKAARRKDPDAIAAVAALPARKATAEAAVAAARGYRTEPLSVHMGWSSASPATDGAALYAAFGNGVVSAFSAEGARRWSVWLGARQGQYEFYDGVPTASVVLHGGVVVVAYDRLVGLDPATGATRWTAGPWVDYGTPTPATVDGLDVLLTPDGRVVRAADGEVLASGLGNHPWFNSPVYADGVAYWVGGRWREDVAPHGFRAEASAWSLRREGEGVVAEQRWVTPLASRDRFYSSPVLDGDRLLAIDNLGRLVALARATGKVTFDARVDPELKAQVWAPLVRAADGVIVQAMDGTLLRLAPDLSVVDRVVVGAGHASPWLEAGGAWVRTHTHLLGWTPRG